MQWETTSKLQLELDKQRREDSDVKREVIQKQAHIDDLKKEMQSKTGILKRMMYSFCFGLMIVPYLKKKKNSMQICRELT